jgi:hypothetical protein
MNKVTRNTDSIFLIVALVFLAAACGPYKDNKKRVAVILNNDPSPRHRLNVERAEQSLKKSSAIDQLIVFESKNEAPKKADVIDAIRNIQEQNDCLSLLYITGHGTLVFNKKYPKGMPSVMLKDRPLSAVDLVNLLGKGPSLIYLDVCFAPYFADELHKSLEGEFLILSDKDHTRPQESCRGISTEFWGAFQFHSNVSICFENAIQAWEKTCPHGYKVEILNNEN